MNPEPIAALKLEGNELLTLDLRSIYRGEYANDVMDLLTLSETENTEVVISDTGLLYDIRYGGQSIGYFAIRNILNTLKLKLRQAELMFHGLLTDDRYIQLRGVKYLIPLFGVSDVC